MIPASNFPCRAIPGWAWSPVSRRLGLGALALAGCVTSDSMSRADAVMMYGPFPLSLRAVEDLLFERGTDICHETVRFWWNRFGPMFASEILRERVSRMREIRHWRWHLDEVFVNING
jgi:hypothetical protein